MRFLFLIVFIFPNFTFAHEHHDAEMKGTKPVSGNSVLQLGSNWKNQKGEVVNISTLKGKPHLLVMLFTRCETACPLIVEDLKEVAKEIDSIKYHAVDVSIFSLDSYRETPESLLAFSSKRKIPKDWQLYTSDADAVAELAAALGVRYKRLQNGDFIHSNVIYFLNSNGEVAAQKEGIKTSRGEFIKSIKKNL